MKSSNQTAASLPRLAMFFLLVFTKAVPWQVDKGRARSGRLRSSFPLVIRGRAGTIEKQKNKLSRPLWTACGRSELRKKLRRPACPQPWTQFRGGNGSIPQPGLDSHYPTEYILCRASNDFLLGQLEPSGLKPFGTFFFVTKPKPANAAGPSIQD